jgi:pimeloyl-ACP methyl ester carboxylesterase
MPTVSPPAASRSTWNSRGVQVKRRLVVYVQGYDPRGLAEYYRMFRREYRRTCELYGLTGQVGRAEDDPDRFITTWDAETRGDGWQVQMHYMFLRWEDIIRRDFARPPWWKILNMYRTYALSIFSGVVPHIVRAHWRFGLFTLYPVVLMTGFALFGALIGWLVADAADALGAHGLAAGLTGAAAGFGLFAGLLWLTERQTYLLYLCDDAVSTYQFAHGRRPDWEERMETFAGYLVDAVRASDADEVVVVGHSSGSFLAVDVLDRALTRDPDLGQRVPRVRLLTVGANLPIVGFHRAAQWFRNRIERLALSPNIDWVDYQSRHDIMNFWPFDPVAGHGIALQQQRRNPQVVPVSFRDLWVADSFDRRRWRFFEAHFQFLRANDRRGAAYDYYLICCGPIDLATRATRPAEAVAMMAKSGQTRPAVEL